METTEILWCYRCGKRRTHLDMAFVDGRSYCHPSLSTKETCYMKKQAARDESDGFSIQSHSSGLWLDDDGVVHSVTFDDERESGGFELLPPIRDYSAGSVPIPVQLDDAAGGVSSPEGNP